MVAANRVAAVNPPIDDTDPIRKFSIDPGGHTDLQTAAEFSPKGKPIRNFSIDPMHIVDTDTIAGAVFADAISETSNLKPGLGTPDCRECALVPVFWTVVPFFCTLIPVLGVPRSDFCTLVLVFGVQDHPSKPPFWKPPCLANPRYDFGGSAGQPDRAH